MPTVHEIALSAIVIVVSSVAVAFVIRKLSKCSKPKITLEQSGVKYALRLVDKEIISHDTRKFTFALQTPEHILGLPVGRHIYLTAMINGELVVRPYTPTSSDDTKGYMVLVIKVYKRDVNLKFPAGGKMSQYLDELEIGKHIDVRGPNGKLTYNGFGKFSIVSKPNSEASIKRVTKVGMIAGGTGITPMYQLMKSILHVKKDQTEVSLLFANQSEDDILLREEIDNEICDQFMVWYTVDKAEDGWSYDVGFITEKMIQDHLPEPSEETIILICGPPPMVKYACLPNLEKLGYTEDMIFCY